MKTKTRKNKHNHKRSKPTARTATQPEPNLGRFALAKRGTELARKSSATLEAVSMTSYMGDKPGRAIDADMAAYGAFTWVYAAICAIATSAAGVGFVLMKEYPTGEVEEITQHPILDLLLKPNQRMSGQNLIEMTFTQMEATGNAFWELVYDRYGVVKEIYTLNPKRMKIIDDPKKYVTGYVFEVNGKKVEFAPEQVEHFKYPDPDNEFWGMSPMSAVRKNALKLERHAMTWNQRFFENSARPDIMFTVQEAMGERAFRRFVARLKQMFRGSDKAHSALIGEGGIKVEQLGFPPKDIEFLQMRKFSRDEVLACFGVPPVMVGIFESAIRANADVQRRIFWEGTMVPKMKNIEALLNMSFVPKFDRFVDGDTKLKLGFDLSRVDALRDVASDMTDRIVTQVESRIITRNEARLELGYETMGPELDVIDEKPQPVVPGQESMVEMVHSPSRIKLLDPVYREVMRKQAEERKKPFEDMMAGDWKRLFEATARDVNERLNMLLKGRRRKLYAKSVSVETVFPEQAAGKAANDVLEQELTEVMRAGGNYAALELSIDLGVNAEGFNAVSPRVVDFVRNEAFEKSKLITQTTKERLRAILDDAFAREVNLRELTGLISDELTGTAAESRIATIVRTEVGTAYSKSNRMAAEQVLEKNPGVSLYKVWISVRDDKVRPAHRENDELTQRTPVKFDYVYPSNGMLHPHDPNGGAGQVINCRCSERHVSGTLVEAGFKRYRRMRTTDGLVRVARIIGGPFSKRNSGDIASRVGEVVFRQVRDLVRLHGPGNGRH